MVLRSFLFLDDTDSTGESNPISCTNGKQLALNVELITSGESIDLDVMGQIDLDGDYQTLGVISAIDFATASSISAEGIYFIPVDGIIRVKIVNNGTAGSVKVFGTLTD